MSSRRTAVNANAHNDPPNRQAGSLVMTEQWWRDRYGQLAEHGYELRPRYHPRWQPSWLKSGKDFYTVEDGQPTIVRVMVLVFAPQLKLGTVEGSDGCNPRARQPSSHVQKSPPCRGTSRTED